MNFKDFLIEITNKELRKLEDNWKPDDSLNDIFGKNLRILIPLEQSEEQRLERSLEDLGYKPDLKKGVAYKKIQTQSGEKTREERIGSILSKAKNKELLHWWETNKGKLNQSNTGASIIISRAPIDIIRMSDHSELSSCHSPGGSYFKCAVQEAKTGGAVAFVVKNSDIKDLNLQADELFRDRQRKIDGIEPLERIRLRKFSVNNTYLLVPERRTYGIGHVGLKEAIMGWARHIQRDKMKEIPKWKDIKFHGGSYQDNRADELLNSFFNTSEYSGSKQSQDKRDEAEGGIDVDRMNELAQKQIRQHKYKYYHVYAEANESDGITYLSYDASVVFEFDFRLFKELPKEKDLKASRYSNKDTFGHDVRDALEASIQDITMDRMMNKVRFIITIDDEDQEGDNELERLEHFLDYIDDMEEHYIPHYHSIEQLLLDYGFLKDRTEGIEFRHFKFEKQSDTRSKNTEHYVISEPMVIGDLLGVDNNIIGYKDINSPDFKAIFPRFVNVESKVSSNLISHMDWRRKYYTFGEPHPIKDPLTLSLILTIQVPHDNMEKFVQQVKFMDKNWDYFNKRAAQYWEQSKAKMINRDTYTQPPSPIQPSKRDKFKQLELPFEKTVPPTTP